MWGSSYRFCLEEVAVRSMALKCAREPGETGEGGQRPARQRQPSRTVKQITLAFVKQAKIHGVRLVCSRHYPLHRRAVWFLIVCTSLGLLVSFASNRFLHLLSFPSHTRLHMEWTKELHFPAITICNNNPIRFYQLTKSDLYYTGHWLGLLMENHTARPLIIELIGEDRIQCMDFMDRLGHPLDDMLLSCKYRGDMCGPQNFTSVFTRYGKCYMFNSGSDDKPLLTTVQGGTGNGLEIMLDIQQDDYLPVWGETDTTFEAGIRVQLHTQSEPPFVHELGFGVAPGFQTFVSTQEQRLIYLPPPWGDCQPLTDNTEFFPTYSITACRIDCETRYLVENCNCRMVHMPGDAHYCTPEQYKECAEPTLALLAEKNNHCVCKMPCYLTRYNKELSMVKIPSRTSAKYLEKKFNKTEKYISENILVLDVFFEALNYETIEQKRAYEVAGLLGDIGGQMGLFIGASILSVLELFDYLYEVRFCEILEFQWSDLQAYHFTVQLRSKAFDLCNLHQDFSSDYKPCLIPPSCSLLIGSSIPQHFIFFFK
uniref:Acid sensing ion channel subunit 2 n=1 Tax=Callorhinchus milii TaxID=7868 RepID=A0A4W3HVL8_CALMI